MTSGDVFGAVTPEQQLSDRPQGNEPAYGKKTDTGHCNSKQSKVTAAKICRAALCLAFGAVFLFALYTELSSAIKTFVPVCTKAFSSLAFGGYYASVDISQPPSNSVTRPHKTDFEMVELGDGDSDSGNGNKTDNNNESSAGDKPENEPPPTGDVYPIAVKDLSTNAKRGLSCSNQTDYKLDLPAFADGEFVLPPLSELIASHPENPDAPVVLIIHTHGTECYSPEGSDTYSKKDNCRTKDVTKNVVAVGAVIADYLESRGIPTLHCTEMFDKDSYSKAYSNSSAAVREYLAIYPSIKYVFDVHRDSIISSDYIKYRPLTVINGVETAQVMILIGTDARGSAHPDWRDNLTLAAHLQTRLFSRSSSLARKLSVRSGAFYQQYAPGSLLFEVGSCGNTLSQAKAAARVLAEELAEIIIKGE